MPAAYEFTSSQVNSMIRRYNNGEVMQALAEHYGVSIPVVRRILAENNVTIRPRGRRPQS